jgi:hypothetical protein
MNTWGFWLWRATLADAKRTGNTERLAAFIRQLGRLGKRECDDLAALLEGGCLTLKKTRARSSLERHLAWAHDNYRWMRKNGAAVGINADGSPQIKRVSRKEALDVICRVYGKEWKFSREQLEAQIDGKRSAAGRAAKKRMKTSAQK